MDPLRTVTTTGIGAVSVPRDVAVLSVAAVHRAPTLADALSGAESAREAVVRIAADHVAADAIATEGLATWPQHDQQGRPDGFEARHALRVRCADLDTAARLLQALAEETGDRLSVDGVSIASSPDPEHLGSAREAAYADALARAEHLARLAGGALGGVVSLTEVSAPGYPAVPREALAAKSDVGFAGGVEDVSASVTVTWELT